MARDMLRPIGRKIQTARLGHDAIDSEHTEITDCWSQAVNCTPLQFPFLIGRLRKRMAIHFDREDVIMSRVGSSLCSCHRHEHIMLLDLCSRAAALSEHSWRTTQRLLRHEFPKRIREHIIGMDQLLVMQVNLYNEHTAAATCQHEDYAG